MERYNGNWIDAWGACKLCGGEIPYGHTDSCDIWKLERELNNLKHSYQLLVDEREKFIKFTNTLNYPRPKLPLVGPIEIAKHYINYLVESQKK